MKNIFKIGILALTSVFLSNCSDDNNEDIEKVNETKFRIEVSNLSNDLSNFEEVTVIQIISNNNSDVTGVEWENIYQTESFSKQFEYQNDVIPSVVYETTSNVVSLTYSSVIVPKTSSDAVLNTTIKIFANDKLIKTENFNVIDEQNSITIPVVASQL